MSRSYYAGQDLDALPPRPTKAEERRLFREFRRQRTQKRREHLARVYLRFALRLARRDMGLRPEHMRSRPGLSEDDSISAANLGLMVAIERFDPERGFRFTTYAAFWVFKYLMEARYAAHLVAVSDADKRMFTKISAMQKKLGLSDEEVAKTTGLTEEEVQRIAALPLGRTVSPLNGFEELQEKPSPEVDLFEETTSRDELEQEELLRKLNFAMADLSTRSRAVLQDHYFRKLRVSEIARRYRMKPEAVSRILSDALKTLRTKMEN